jgi:hypothetical protein
MKDELEEFVFTSVGVEFVKFEELMNLEWVTAARDMLIDLNVCPHCITHANYDPDHERWYCIECTWNSDWEL